MLNIQINNNEIEQALLNKFKTKTAIEDYFCKLVIKDAEDEAFARMLAEGDCQNFVSKDEVFKALDSACAD